MTEPRQRSGGPVTRDDLVAYVDGRLGEDRREAVEGHLQADPVAAETVAAWRRQDEALRALYDHVAEEPVPARLDVRRLAEARRAGSRAWWRQAAAVVLVAALGAGGGWYARGLSVGGAEADNAGYVADAVNAHRIFTAEVVHPVEVGAERGDHLAAWLSKRLDRKLAPPDIAALGFRLIGGRLLPAGDRPAAQFMYEDASGRRLTLFIWPERDAGESGFRHVDEAGLQALFWTDRTIACALVADLPRPDLEAIATKAYEQLG